MMRELTVFEESYLECALWSSHQDSTDDEDNAMFDFDNKSISDFDEKTLDELLAWANKFYSDNEALILESELDDSEVGHSLWLSQNGHGAGFFDYMDDTGACDKLHELAIYNEVQLYIGDDEKIYSM
jgi:hypothetical protein